MYINISASFACPLNNNEKSTCKGYTCIIRIKHIYMNLMSFLLLPSDTQFKYFGNNVTGNTLNRKKYSARQRQTRSYALSIKKLLVANRSV